MKRLFISLIAIGLCASLSANIDPHLERLFDCIQESDFACAETELPIVKDWTFSRYNKETSFDDQKALQFLEYANSKHLPESMTDSLKLYIALACRKKGVGYEDDEKMAIHYYEISADLIKQVLGNSNLVYADALHILGNHYDAAGEPKKAEPLLLEALKIRKKYRLQDPENYAELLMNLGLFYSGEKNYKKAEKYLLEYAQICEDYLGMEYRMSAIETLWEFYDDIGDKKKAKHYAELLGEEEDDDEVFWTAPAKSQIGADGYLRKRQIALAYLKSLRSQYDYGNKLYAAFTSIIGVNYLDMGDWKRAEEYLLLATRLFEDMEKDSLALNIYELSIGMLGVLYMNMGDYDNAEKILLKSNATIPLGVLYREKGDYPKAETYLVKALNEIESAEGVKSTNYINCLNHLGELYLRMHHYPKAEKCLSNVYKFYKDSLPSEQIMSYTTCVKNLGELYLAMHNYPKAEDFLTLALQAHQIMHGEDHPDYISCINNLGEVYFQKRNYKKAESYFIRARDAQKKTFLSSIDFMSDMQRSRYWETVKDRYVRQYPNFCYRYYVKNKSVSTFAYDNELYTKGLLLTSSNAIRRSILESQDSTLIQDWEQVVNLRNKLRYMQENGSSQDSLTLIEQYAEELEKEVTKESVEYRENLRQWNITWDSVRVALKPNQVAIEFMAAPLNEDSTMYCALLLRHDSKQPKLIPLFNEKDVESQLNKSTINQADISRTYAYDERGGRLTKLIWSAILPYLKETDEVYFSPTGVLHQLAIENLPFDATSSMADHYNLYRLSSTRELALNRPPVTYQTATLYGGISYAEMSDSAMIANSQKYATRGFERLSDDESFDETLRSTITKELPGTAEEVTVIAPILEKHHIAVSVFMKDTANEESVKALSGQKKNLLHFATHGFFLPDNGSGKDPLERSGLVFAGVDKRLRLGNKGVPENVDDGILTSKEIALLDLREADIVVLSACETGLGDISGDGVFGLQRAFKMAGAQTILMALWQVSDEATRMLMTAFYRHYTAGESKREAFRNAQQEVRSSKYRSPYFWAGFVLLD